MRNSEDDENGQNAIKPYRSAI